MTAELILKNFAQKNKIKLSIFRIFTIYGNDMKKQFVWDLYQKIKRKKNNQITLFGSGNEIKDYISIYDLIKCINIVLKKQKRNIEIFNISSGHKIKIKDIVKIIQKKLNMQNLKVNYNQNFLDIFPLNMISNQNKFNKFFKFKPTNFEDNLPYFISRLIRK